MLLHAGLGNNQDIAQFNNFYCKKKIFLYYLKIIMNQAVSTVNIEALKLRAKSK